MAERIRVTGGPWPERIGCEGVIVEPTPEQAKVYPWPGRGKDEVIILLDKDPLLIGPWRPGHYWSCATSRRNVRVIDGCQHYVRTNTHGFPCEDCGELIDGQDA